MKLRSDPELFWRRGLPGRRFLAPGRRYGWRIGQEHELAERSGASKLREREGRGREGGGEIEEESEGDKEGTKR